MGADAEKVAYSSIVGQSIMLLNAQGACIGQLSVINTADHDHIADQVVAALKAKAKDRKEALNDLADMGQEFDASSPDEEQQVPVKFEFEEPFSLTRSEVLGDDVFWLRHNGNSFASFSVKNFGSEQACIEAAWRLAYLSDDAPMVKDLPWESFDAYTYWAHSVVGTYRIEDRGDGAVLRRGEEIIRYIDENGEDLGAWPSIDEAQLAAQADYEKRILSALEVSDG